MASCGDAFAYRVRDREVVHVKEEKRMNRLAHSQIVTPASSWYATLSMPKVQHKLEAIRQFVAEHGELDEPVVVLSNRAGRYLVVDGFLRYVVAQERPEKSVWVVVVENWDLWDHRGLLFGSRKIQPCTYCGKWLLATHDRPAWVPSTVWYQEHLATVDHRVPISRGGRSNVENLCLACVSCNQQKADALDWSPSEQQLWKAQLYNAHFEVWVRQEHPRWARWLSNDHFQEVMA